VLLNPGATLMRAHTDLLVQIALVTARLESEPSAALHLKRGELYRAHEDYAGALQDYARAAALEPELAVVDLCRGIVLHKTGELQPAREALDRAIARKPGQAAAHLARARLLNDCEEYAAARRDFEQAVALSVEPTPDLYLEYVNFQASVGDDPGALATIEEGLARIGNVPTLQSAAMEIELRLGRADAALARVDGLMARVERKETWQARRGDILLSVGRRDEALAAYRTALASLERVAPALRQVRATKALEEKLRTLVDLQAREAARDSTQ
jgi:tetratricopeptide (TPR) repeat protein